jgi:hypothetical protein
LFLKSGLPQRNTSTNQSGQILSPSRKSVYQDGVGLRTGIVYERGKAMHKVEIPSWVVERAAAGRGRLHRFAARTAAAAE